ncbi:unnamed protein product, partial [Hydatigera taeniaeformis]|uniref:MOSC domain-containing protein n=1 Tax=Hydatigena taeniaeformis TaxID=6205 RepID=A0A0R3X8N5_HYDTA
MGAAEPVVASTPQHGPRGLGKQRLWQALIWRRYHCGLTQMSLVFSRTLTLTHLLDIRALRQNSRVVVAYAPPPPPPRAICESLAPHGKCAELRDYVSVCLVMESKRRWDCQPSQNSTTAASLLPARFRCSLLDQLDRIAFTNETERYHLVGPKMGLGFCRFVERSRLYSPTGGETRSAEISEQKDGSPAVVATVTTDDHRLVGPGDRVKFFAE